MLTSLKLKTSLTALLIVCLSSCRHTPNFEVREERCFFSTRFEKCRCFDYLVTNNFSGNISEGRDMPLEYCDNFIGFSPDSWVNWLQEVRSVIRSSGKTSKHELPGMIKHEIDQLDTPL